MDIEELRKNIYQDRWTVRSGYESWATDKPYEDYNSGSMVYPVGPAPDPDDIEYIAENGYSLWSVEDTICEVWDGNRVGETTARHIAFWDPLKTAEVVDYIEKLEAQIAEKDKTIEGLLVAMVEE